MKIAFLLFPATHLMDIAGPAQVFYEATKQGGQTYRLMYISSLERIQTEQQLIFGQLQKIRDVQLELGDLICVPGIDFQSFVQGKMDVCISDGREWVYEQQQNGVRIASICSGALILAKMGLLGGVECTTHWKCLEYLRQNYPLAKVQPNRLYCFDRGIFTSAGMTAGIDMSLALIERWDNPLIAAKVAQEMVINVRRADSVEQRNMFLDFKNHFNADVYKAQEILTNRLQSDFTVSDLANTLNVSPRHLARLFKDHTGQTIQAYRDQVRLKLGEQLLLHTKQSVKEIAVECGFENSRQFIRLWKRNKDSTPGQFRRETPQQV